MSISLSLELIRPLALRPLLPKIGGALAEILGLPSPPGLTLDVVEDGRRIPATTDELQNTSTHLFMISIVCEPETVIVNAAGTFLSVEMGAERTNLEYALGAAAAIALARELSVLIGDDWKFYGDEAEWTADDLLSSLRVRHEHSDYREAAEHLTGRIDKP